MSDEHDHARQVAGDAERRERPLDALAHLPGLGLLEEALRDALVALLQPDADDDQAGDRHEELPGRPAQHAAGGLARAAAGSAAGADQDRHRGDAEHRVADAAREPVDALLGVVARLRPVADRRAHEPPERVAGQADRHEDQERLAERLLRDRVQRALLVRRLAAVAEGELDGEDADDRVDRPARRDARRGPATRTAASCATSSPLDCARRTGMRPALRFWAI